MLAINAQNVVKQYRNGVRALDGININVAEGEVFCLLGLNGAGKSTLINILTTFYKPTLGSISVLGTDLCQSPALIRTKIACVSQRISVDEHLSLMENMWFQSRLYGVSPQIAKERISSLIDSFDLSAYIKYPVSSYSGGVKRRLDIAMNMVSMPKLLFLDEPTVGMDAVSRKAMWDMLLRIKEQYGTTIFLTTHYLEEADQLSDTVCIIKNGKELVQGTPNSLRRYMHQNMLRITFVTADEAKRYSQALSYMEVANFVTVNDNVVTIGVVDSRIALIKVNSWLLENSVSFSGIEIAEPSLEDVFITLTSREVD